jgi:type III pantothenate kinase
MGNSRLSAAVVDGTAVLDARSVPAADSSPWPKFMQWLIETAGNHPVVAASVNPPCEAAFTERYSGSLVMMGRDRPIPIINRTRVPEETGHDRLLAAYAALKLIGPPLLVIDFGTAITFNVIDGAGAFIGGAIVPGLDLASASLSKGCALLPRVDLSGQDVPLVGRDTVSAMCSGLWNGYLGLVESMLERYLAQGEKKVQVVVTGGQAGLFRSRIPGMHHHDEFLLLKGIALAYEATRLEC